MVGDVWVPTCMYIYPAVYIYYRVFAILSDVTTFYFVYWDLTVYVESLIQNLKFDSLRGVTAIRLR